MSSQFASDFMLDLGGVAGYIDQIQHKIWCEAGRQIVGMNFQTRSSIMNGILEIGLNNQTLPVSLMKLAAIRL